MEQFYDFYAVSIFRQTGTSLEEIRRCLKEQDAAKTLKRLRRQQKRLEEKRQDLEQMEFVLSGMIQNLELGTLPDMAPRSVWFAKEHLLAVPMEELEQIIPVSGGEDEMLIAVLERCRALCRQYKVQTDFQLGAIHLPGESADQATISHLYIREQKLRTAGNFYACDLAGFTLNGMEKNAASLISVRTEQA